MPYLPLIPLPGDKKKISQADIKNNFTLLEDTYNGINEKIVLKEQLVKPTLAANQMALYTKEIGGISAMFLEKEDGTEVDFTTHGAAVNGWCKLPNGIKQLWMFKDLNTSSTTTFTFASVVGFPGFTSVFSVQTSPYSGTNLNYPITIRSYSTTNVIVHTVNGSGTYGFIFVVGN